MNAEVKKRWIEALRSGEYKQTQRTLRNDQGYCCLGVLCDIHSKTPGGSKWQGISKHYNYLNRSAHLPSPVYEWAGLNEAAVFIPAYHLSLAAMNDRGDSFDDIAKVIEENL